MRCVKPFFVSLTLILSLVSYVNGLPVSTKDPSVVKEQNESNDKPRNFYRRQGMKHKDEITNPANAATPFKAVPNHHYYATQNGVYSGAAVNAAANNLMTDVANAPAYRSGGRPGYPKVSTGFGKDNPSNPLGPHRATDKANDPNHISYHHPIGNTPGGRPGPDRIVASRPNAPNSQYNLGVSFHDSRKPVGNGGNHPFSQAKAWKTSSPTVNKIGANVQSKGMKAQGAVNGAARKVGAGAKKAGGAVGSAVGKAGGAIKGMFKKT